MLTLYTPTLGIVLAVVEVMVLGVLVGRGRRSTASPRPQPRALPRGNA